MPVCVLGIHSVVMATVEIAMGWVDQDRQEMTIGGSPLPPLPPPPMPQLLERRAVGGSTGILRQPLVQVDCALLPASSS